MASLKATSICTVLGMTAVAAAAGIAGLLKFWIMPWVAWHFWMGVITMVQHTAAHIPYRSPGDWHAARAQLMGTVHCDYPDWYVTSYGHSINTSSVTGLGGLVNSSSSDYSNQPPLWKTRRSVTKYSNSPALPVYPVACAVSQRTVPCGDIAPYRSPGDWQIARAHVM